MLRKKFDVIEYITKKIEENIIKEKLINDNDSIVVAVSGGPDSMCLLTVLNNLKPIFKEKYNISYSLYVAHVNHMIREESELEKEYVEKYCNDLSIPFYYLKENIPDISKKLKMSEEACGRKIRYEFFDKVCLDTNSNKIATAHNLNDDSETIILNLIRGCGLAGLTGMSFKYKNIIRPLLNIEKKYILEYNNVYNLNPCIDKTNFENVYVRNKIRNLLIPNLESEYNSNIVDNIIRMKNILRLDNDFLEKYTTKVVEKSIIENTSNSIVFDFSHILLEHESIKLRAIRCIVEKNIGNLDGISNVHINDILDLLERNIRGKKYIIGNKFELEIIRKNVAKIIKGGKNEEKFSC